MLNKLQKNVMRLLRAGYVITLSKRFDLDALEIGVVDDDGNVKHTLHIIDDDQDALSAAVISGSKTVADAEEV